MHTLEKRKRVKTKLKLGVCVAAFVAAISIFIILLQVEKNVLSQYEKVIVCVAVREIPKGMVITEQNCMDYFGWKETDKKCISDSTLTDFKQLIGLVPVYDVEKGTLVSFGMFEELNEVLQAMKEPVIAGLKADDLYQVAGGIIRAGDRVHIYKVNEDGTDLCWENIYVQEVFDQSGQIIPNDDRTRCAQRINIYMDKLDIEEFYSDIQGGALRVVKVCQ